jgi:hypothetical protein
MLPIRFMEDGIRRAINHHCRDAHHGGNMHRARVTSNIEIAVPEYFS